MPIRFSHHDGRDVLWATKGAPHVGAPTRSTSPTVAVAVTAPPREPLIGAGSTSGFARAFSNGDDEGFGALYLRIAPALIAWAKLRVLPPLSLEFPVDDVVHDVFLRSLSQFKHYDPARGTFRQWIFGIANHVLMEALRRARRENQRLPEDAVDLEAIPDEVRSISDALNSSEAIKQFVSAIQKFDCDDQRHVILRIEGHDSEAIGELLDGVSAGAVRTRWYRLAPRIAEVLKDSDILDLNAER